MSRRTDADADTSEDDDRLVDACPACMSRRIGRQIPGVPFYNPETESDWRCNDCDHYFDEPHQRASAQGAPWDRGTIILAAADPDTPIDELAERYGHIGGGGDSE